MTESQELEKSFGKNKKESSSLNASINQDFNPRFAKNLLILLYSNL